MFHRFLYVYQAGYQSPDLVIRVIAKPTTRNGRSRLKNWSTCPIYVRSCSSPVLGQGGVVLYSPPQEPHAGHVSGGLKKWPQVRNHCIEKAVGKQQSSTMTLSLILDCSFIRYLKEPDAFWLTTLQPRGISWYQKFDSHDWAKLGEKNLTVFQNCISCCWWYLFYSSKTKTWHGCFDTPFYSH